MHERNDAVDYETTIIVRVILLRRTLIRLGDVLAVAAGGAASEGKENQDRARGPVEVIIIDDDDD